MRLSPILAAVAVLAAAGGAAAAPPELTLPPDMTVEADGPGGTIVTFSATATNSGRAVFPVTCTPPSGSTFPLGTTEVECAAVLSEEETLTGSFHISVRDSTPPTLTVPADLSLTAETSLGLDGTDERIAAFLAGAIATDVVTIEPPVVHDAPATFPVGTTAVTFTATDAAGNSTSKSATVAVIGPPPPGSPPSDPPPPGQPGPPSATTPPDRVPPGNPVGLAARTTSRTAFLSWRAPADQDLDRYEVLRSLASEPPASASRVYAGPVAGFTDRRLQNGVLYRYVVVSVDRAENRSAGAAITVMPRRALLVAPRDGARLSAPPRLFWARIRGATYYNVQLFRGRTKVLSAWPSANALRLSSRWRFEGRQLALAPGTYHWYVWPGYGRRAAARYGELLGPSSFVVVKR
ncbi:MAG: HYR domain-containing protein [Thermoleophilia bacterium]|nr:HYR domain-containing protein [Thermoleophilia bacterium]